MVMMTNERHFHFFYKDSTPVDNFQPIQLTELVYKCADELEFELNVLTSGRSKTYK